MAESKEIALVSISDIEKMAIAIAKSQLFSMKTPEQAFALMMIAQAEGRHPASAAQDYHIILNRPALKADAILARFQVAGGKVKWTEYTDDAVEGEFSHEQGGTLKVKWTLEMAKRIGLYPLKDNWKNYPRAMLRARVISEGVRTIYPKVLCGFYAEEEVADFEEIPKTPANPLFAKKTDAEVISSVTQPPQTAELPSTAATTQGSVPAPSQTTTPELKAAKTPRTREEKLAELLKSFGPEDIEWAYKFFIAKKWLPENVDMQDMEEVRIDKALELLASGELMKFFTPWKTKQLNDLKAAAGKAA
jgi:hypothetical protein